MEKFDFKTKKATPEWLTSVLVKNGFLSNGGVTSIEQRDPLFPGLASTFLALGVTYSPGSLGVMPSKILMKIPKPEYYSNTEIDFYDEVSDSKALSPLLTCYGVDKNPEMKQGYMLLEDLTETHHHIPWPLPPVQVQSKDAITVLADIHAYWWNDSRFGEPGFELPEEEGLRDLFQYCGEVLPNFVDFLADRLSEKRKKTYEFIFEKAPELILNRRSSSKGLTILHGDAHFGNILFPNDREQNQCVIFDWQDWGVGLGARDLSYMIALHYFPEHRQRIEQMLLKFYLQELQKQSIDYDWEELYTDYRIYVIFNLIFPMLWQSRGIPQHIWWFRHENVLNAFEDLDCMELL